MGPVYIGLDDSDGIDTDSPIFFKPPAGYEKRRKDPDPGSGLGAAQWDHRVIIIGSSDGGGT